MNNRIIEINDLWRTYHRGNEVINACAGIDLTITRGEMVAIVGRSGSGKTTLLNQIGGLDSPSQGQIKIDGIEMTSMQESELVNFRREKIGFVFQLFYLIPTLTVWENVELPLIFSRKRNKKQVYNVLQQAGITGMEKLFPSQLDGGSMQKVAIARALVNTPEILLADEPTGRLESDSKETILTLFNTLTAQGLTIIIATHDLALAQRAGRIVRLSDGSIQGLKGVKNA